jgi:hypothetical protein
MRQHMAQEDSPCLVLRSQNANWSKGFSRNANCFECDQPMPVQGQLHLVIMKKLAERTAIMLSVHGPEPTRTSENRQRRPTSKR